MSIFLSTFIKQLYRMEWKWTHGGTYSRSKRPINNNLANGNYGNSNVAGYLPSYTGNLGGTITTANQPNRNAWACGPDGPCSRCLSLPFLDAPFKHRTHQSFFSMG